MALKSATGLAAVSFLQLLFACGGGGVPIERYGSETLKAFCSAYARCGIAASASGCVQSLEPTLGSSFQSSTERYSTLVSAGKARWDAAAAQRCIEALEKRSCDEVVSFGFTSNEDCNATFLGQVKVGEPCGSFECVREAFCDLSSGSCPGTCRARIPEGGMTSDLSACAAGLVLFQNKCTKAPTVGMPCAQFCVAGAVCVNGMCQAIKQVGESCASGSECGTLRPCVAGKCANPGAAASACADGSCQVELRCDRTLAVPVCAPPAASGGRCVSGSDCAPNLVCTGAASTAVCGTPTPEGQSCTSTPCGAGLFCDSSKVCKRQLATGADCSMTEPGACKDGFCKTGKCVSFAAPFCP